MMQSTTIRRAFSVSDANATLPLVRAIVADLVDLTADVESREARVARLLKLRSEDDRKDPYEDELREVQRSLVEDRAQLARYTSELENVGVRVRQASAGLIEFPSFLGEKEVFLLWSPNSPQVTQWVESATGAPVDIKDLEFTASAVKRGRFSNRTGDRQNRGSGDNL